MRDAVSRVQIFFFFLPTDANDSVKGIPTSIPMTPIQRENVGTPCVLVSSWIAVA